MSRLVPVGALRVGHVEADDVAGAVDVGELAVDPLVVAARLALAVAADDVRAAEDPHLATVALARVLLDLGIWSAAVSKLVRPA